MKQSSKRKTFKECVVRDLEGKEHIRRSHGANWAGDFKNKGWTPVREEVLVEECDRLARGESCAACTFGLEQMAAGKKPATEYVISDDAPPDGRGGSSSQDLLDLRGLYVWRSWDENCKRWVGKIGRGEVIGARVPRTAKLIAAFPVHGSLVAEEARLLNVFRGQFQSCFGREYFWWDEIASFVTLLTTLPGWMVPSER